jgi:hypothetical protein
MNTTRLLLLRVSWTYLLVAPQRRAPHRGHLGLGRLVEALVGVALVPLVVEERGPDPPRRPALLDDEAVIYRIWVDARHGPGRETQVRRGDQKKEP